MTELTDEAVKTLEHKYRFAKDDNEHTIAKTARALLDARAERDRLRADAQAAVALVVEKAGLAVANVEIGFHDGISGEWHPMAGPSIISAACAAIRALAPADGLAAVDALSDAAAQLANAEASLHQHGEVARLNFLHLMSVEADRDRLAAANAALEAERDRINQWRETAIVERDTYSEERDDALARLAAAEAQVGALRLQLDQKDALYDSGFQAGVKLGWNFGVSGDEAGFQAATSSTEHVAELKRIRAALAEVQADPKP